MVQWDFGDPTSGSLNVAFGTKVNHKFSILSQYNIRAIIKKLNGTDTLYLNGLTIVNCIETLKCGEVFVPNAFSPNGDGENDVLKVYGNCISELVFAIFNRWGEQVFSATQTTQKWDGTFKGQEINNAVFYYRLSARLTNGQTV